jgi:hypothetical protein
MQRKMETTRMEEKVVRKDAMNKTGLHSVRTKEQAEVLVPMSCQTRIERPTCVKKPLHNSARYPGNR